MLGGLFYVTRRSIISVVDSTLFNNFSVKASIAYVGNQGTLEISNSDISRNQAISIGILEIVDSVAANRISNSSIYSNSLVTKEITLKELDDSTICVNLCFASTGYLNYLNENRTILNEAVTSALISTTEGTLSLVNGCEFRNMDQLSIGNSFRSTITLSDAKVYSLNLKMSVFILLRSDFVMNSVDFQDITRNIDSTARVFRVESSSTAAISNSTFSNINFSVISVTDSSIQLYDSEMKNITASQNIIECYTSTGIIFRNFTMSDSQSTSRPSMINFRS